MSLVSNDAAGSEIFRDDTNESTSAGVGVYETFHEFRLFGTGTTAVRIAAHCPVSATGSGGTLIGGKARLLRNGSTVVGSEQTLSITPGAEIVWTGISVPDITDTFEIQLASGQSFAQVASDPPDNFEEPALLDWTSARSRLMLGESV